MSRSSAFAPVRFIRASTVLIASLIAMTLNAAPANTQGAPAPRSEAQIEQLVAPIALYPDALLSQVLMASTYPVDVVAAARWVQAHPGVTGQGLEDAMQKENWDPSVKALTAVPQTLQMMNDKIEWTRELGDVFLAQQQDVLNAAQRLRQRADTTGYLKSTAQQKVTKVTLPATAPAPSTSTGAPTTVYTIEPTTQDQYYVPVYDPSVVYGSWPYPSYPPYYWYPPGFGAGNALSFTAGALAGAAIWGNIDWSRNNININANRYNQFNRTNIGSGNQVWHHNVARGGNRGLNASRETFRGRANAGQRELATQHRTGNLGQKGAANLGQKGAGNLAQKGKGNVGQKTGARGNAGGKHVADGGGKHGAGAKKAGSNKQARATHTARPKQTGGGSAVGGAERHATHHRAARSGGGHANHGHGARVANMGGGGAMRGGGGMRGGGRGGGRRSDIALKHDIVLLGHLDNGLGFYRFAYNGSTRTYVGVMAQEVLNAMPSAVVRGRDGYLRVFYDKIGVKFETYDQWVASGGHVPTGARLH